MALPTIPAGPWTVETLGDELYKKLGVEHGILDPALVGPGYRPALDLTEPYNAQEAAKAKIPVYVLDRPNPIGGLGVQGNAYVDEAVCLALRVALGVVPDAQEVAA